MVAISTLAEAHVKLEARPGPRSSALVGGYTVEHRDLETQLLSLKETEEALLFPSGFAANQVSPPRIPCLLP